MNECILSELPLPPPAASEVMPLFAALQRRRTIRDILSTPVPMHMLGNLLWAGQGVNRWSGPFGATGRTAPSASNSQEIDIFVALPIAIYCYDACMHRLILAASGDLRKAALTPGQQNVVSVAPVQLIYVADLDRLEHTQGFDEPRLHDPETQKAYYYVDCGLIAGNVGLYAATAGLAAWFHNCDRAALRVALHLRKTQRVLFAQSLGYPEEDA